MDKNIIKLINKITDQHQKIVQKMLANHQVRWNAMLEGEVGAVAPESVHKYTEMFLTKVKEIVAAATGAK